MVTGSVIINGFLANFAIWKHYSTAFSREQRKIAEEFRKKTAAFLEDHRMLWVRAALPPIFLAKTGKSGLHSSPLLISFMPQEGWFLPLRFPQGPPWQTFQG
jgi:hypothetical protein